MASETYRQAFAPGNGESFALSEDGVAIEFIHVPGNPAAVIVRAKILDMADVPRAEDFAKAVVAGNFFWGGSRGATLSVDIDHSLWITERRLLDDLGDADLLGKCLADFIQTITDWQERSSLYA